jgi:preprotein translocase subunit SecA
MIDGKAMTAWFSTEITFAQLDVQLSGAQYGGNRRNPKMPNDEGFSPEVVEDEFDNTDESTISMEEVMGKMSGGVPFGSWAEPFRRERPKIGRNEPCPCGSGKKFKKCCESRI